MDYWTHPLQVEVEQPAEQADAPTGTDRALELKRAANEYWLCVTQGELEGMSYSEHFCQLSWYENTKHIDPAPNTPWR